MSGARAAVASLFFINGFVLATWIPYIPSVKRHHQVGDGQLGIILFALTLGGVLGLPLAGWLVARCGSRRVAVAAAASVCLTLPAPVFAPSAIAVALALIVFGVFNGMLDVSMNAQAVDLERRRGRPIMSSFHALFSLGGLAGAGAASATMFAHVAPVLHVGAVSLGMVALVLAAWPALVVSPPSPASSERVFARPPRQLAALGLLALCGLLAEGAMADWTAVYLRDVLATSPGTAALGFAAFSLAMAAGRFAGDALTRRWGAARVLRVSSVIAALGLASALLLHDAAAAVVGFGAVGLGIANIVPLVFSAAGRTRGITPGTALAAVATLGYLGWLAGPPVIGLVAEALGLPAALGIVSAVCAFVALRASSVSEPAPEVRVPAGGDAGVPAPSRQHAR